jgi:DNA polymerase-4
VTTERRLLHIDFVDFVASIEERDAPRLRDRPFIVTSGSNGVVLGVSETGRALGIRVTSSARGARDQHPNVAILPPRHLAYRDSAQHVDAILDKHARAVERTPDDAYADLTHPRTNNDSVVTARMIRQELSRNGFTAKYGFSNNKLIARVASASAQMGEMVALSDSEGRVALRALPIASLPGIGPRTESVLSGLGVHTGAHLQRFTRTELTQLLGTHGAFVFNIVNGVDHRPVQASIPQKSLSAECNLGPDESAEDALPILCIRLASRLADGQKAARTIGLRATAANGRGVSRTWSRETALSHAAEILASAMPLLAAAQDALGHTVDGMQLSLGGLVDTPGVRQAGLFDPLN